jgi:hypothetical protein
MRQQSALDINKRLERKGATKSQETGFPWGPTAISCDLGRSLAVALVFMRAFIFLEANCWADRISH